MIRFQDPRWSAFLAILNLKAPESGWDYRRETTDMPAGLIRDKFKCCPIENALGWTDPHNGIWVPSNRNQPRFGIPDEYGRDMPKLPTPKLTLRTIMAAADNTGEFSILVWGVPATPELRKLLNDLRTDMLDAIGLKE